MRVTHLIATIVLPALLLAQAPAPLPHYEQVYTLKPKEGVFAYARISPDGKRLAYASQITARPANQRGWTVTVVDLATQNALFSETGIDAYWSIDGKRIIYSGDKGVTIWNVETGAASRAPEASRLGDYFSWAVRDGKNLILTIQSNYYYLDGDKPLLPHSKVPSCDKIGVGERPLISKDGKRITTFVKGNLVVRGLDNCENIIDTGIQGSKADFSWDGRYIAFHAVKPQGTGYEIRIVDLEKRTVRTLPGLEGSALFPSWTEDGRLCFRYDGPDFRGFMMASNVLSVPAASLPAVPETLPDRRIWQDIFPETPAQQSGMRLVMIWAPWSAHSLEAFTNLQEARKYFSAHDIRIDVMAAADPGSPETDVARQLSDFKVTVPHIRLSQKGLAMTEARNQMPTTLLFRDGTLIGQRLGAQSFEQLRDWVGAAATLNH
jgi:WD40-like Beta Propeller Repeat